MADPIPSGIDHDRDRRSRKFVLAIECILNQNARVPGAAAWPAMNRGLVELCDRHGAGIVQIPCPEMFCLRWARERPDGVDLLAAMASEEGRAGCRKLSGIMADRVADYIENGYRPLAVLGGNPRSPGCAVHYVGDRVGGDFGVFMQEFHAKLRERGIELPFRGIRDYDARLMAEDLKWLEELLAAS
jgi:predicted secreted protein